MDPTLRAILEDLAQTRAQLTRALDVIESLTAENERLRGLIPPAEPAP